MKSIRQLLSKITTSAALLLTSFSAFAGAPVGPTMNINTSAAAASSATGIPTLSGTMLVVLSLLLFAVATRVAKQKNNGINKMFVTLIGVGSLSLVTGGVKIVSTADAALHGNIPILLDSLEIGDSIVNLGTGFVWHDDNSYNEVNNTTPGTMLEVTGINLNGATCGPALDGGGEQITINGEISPATGNTCVVGTILKFEEACELQCLVTAPPAIIPPFTFPTTLE